MPNSDYTSRDAVKAFLGRTDTNSDTTIDALIPAISRAIDRFCRRQFFLTTATRYYDHTSFTKLWFREDLYSMTSFVDGDGVSFTEGTHYRLWPYDGPPYWKLEIRPDVGQLINPGDSTLHCLVATGQWGFSVSAPAGVEQAATAWAANIVNLSAKAGIQSVSIGEYSISYGDGLVSLSEPIGVAKALLAPYVRRDFHGYQRR